jgi:hypothetical protein
MLHAQGVDVSRFALMTRKIFLAEGHAQKLSHFLKGSPGNTFFSRHFPGETRFSCHSRLTDMYPEARIRLVDSDRCTYGREYNPGRVYNYRRVFLSKSRSRANESNFSQPDEDRPAIRNRRTRGTDTFLTLPTETDQTLMPCRVNRTFRLFEKLRISQQPNSKPGTKLVYEVVYPVRNSELMIPNR